MLDLKSVLKALDAAIDRPQAKVVIVSDQGSIGESSLLGTRDGYLRLAKEIVALVLTADERNSDSSGHVETAGEKTFWSDAVANCFLDLPSLDECAVVGAYVYDDHQSLRMGIESLFVHDGWQNDPDFECPPSKAN